MGKKRATQRPTQRATPRSNRRRKEKLIRSETESESEDDRTVEEKGGFFSGWFGVVATTESDTIDGDDTTYDDGEEDRTISTESTDSIEQDYPYRKSNGDEARNQKLKLEQDKAVESDTEDETSLIEFDRDLRARHSQACKYMRNGKFDRALKKFEGILASILERYGETHHRVGAALHNVGIANLRAGKLNDAHDAIMEAVRIRKLTLGAHSPKVADSLVEFGIILLSLKEYNDSLKVFQEALEMRESEAEDVVLPEDVKESNLKVAKVLNNIGCVNFEEGNYNDSKEAFEDAIAIQKKALQGSAFSFHDPTSKPGFLTMASTMCNLGYIHLEEKKYNDACRLFGQSLKIQKLLLGADNKLVLSTLDNLGYACTKNKAYDKAEKTYKELYSNQEKSYGESELDCASTLKKIIFVQLERQDYDRALELLGQLEDIQLEHYGRDSQEVKGTQQLMGEVNYHVLKYPTGGWIMSCGANSDDVMDTSTFCPPKPTNGSKMSGHRVTCA